MNKEKIYILQKDSPLNKAGTEFSWDCGRYRCPLKKEIYLDEEVENNPDWFKLKKEEKPFVVNFNSAGNDMEFKVRVGNLFPDKEYSMSKERLAELLIAESKSEIMLAKYFNYVIEKEKFSQEKEKLYTEKEWLQFGEECFNAATMCLLDPKEPFYRKKYESFSDYMNDLKK